jgi:hypothetical protein
MFRELHLMLELVKAGVPTIAWAALVLACLIFMLGLLMRQTVGRWCALEGEERSVHCSSGHLAEFSKDLFSTVPRACFTVFRCFTEGCESVDGTPLLVHVLEASWPGTCLACIYSVVYMFVVFGVFNIITGVLVEKSIASARLGEIAVAQERKQKMLRKCRNLGRLLKQLCRGVERSSNSGDHADGPTMISRQVFATIATYPEVQQLLRDIGVTQTNGTVIFDLVDVRKRGRIEVDEFVLGLPNLQVPEGASPTLRLIEAEVAFAALSQSLQVSRRSPSQWSIIDDRRGHDLSG